MKTKKMTEKKAVKKIKTAPRKKSSASSALGKAGLIAIFSVIKPLMKKYEVPFVARVDNNSQYHLWSEKEVVIANRPRKEVWQLYTSWDKAFKWTPGGLSLLFILTLWATKITQPLVGTLVQG